ncbi:MAG: hypothetical protein JWM85_1330 [Acidimicrobiaceae bacterium]|nr:hypothetical protein [Acidimicrobiaceae bacterium]
MLHQDVLMKDIDVDHWRNLQALLLDSAKGRRRIVVIHEDGEVLKLVHSDRLPVLGAVSRVGDPHALADQLYRDNQESVDFVAVFERRAFDEYFGRFQATWSPEEDLDEFVHRSYALLEEYPQGIVTRPEPPRSTLGLQWRLGSSYEDVKDAVHKFVPADSTVVFGIFDGDELWASLVLGFDADRRVDVVTTADPSELEKSGSLEDRARELVSWVEQRHRPCSVALFTKLGEARSFLLAGDKGAALRDLATRGELIACRAPAALQEAVAP